MANYITHAPLNLLNGTLVGDMEFQPRLNIISGENGTLKTRVLQAMKQQGNVKGSSGEPLRIQAISPKRNAERRTVQTILQTLRAQNRTLDSVLNERTAAQINDNTFDPYPSLGDLYFLMFDDIKRDGGEQRATMDKLTADFNQVIRQVFEDYALEASWNPEVGVPDLRIKKRQQSFQLEGLSLGEQEILSLVANLYAARKAHDVYLIDEPEVHLNWHLEERLFDYLDAFCKEHDKQIIVATHSRVIFRARFLSRTQFLFWDGSGKVAWGPDLTDDQRRRLAGEAIDIIKMGHFEKPTFFVEDARHVQILEQLATALGSEIAVTECGNCPNVRSLFRFSKTEGGWRNSMFLTDGDNEGNPFPNETGFIHLDKYCLENYLLDLGLAAAASEKEESLVKEALLNSIKERRAAILKKNQFFEFLVDGLMVEHLTPERLAKLDASEIIDRFVGGLGLSFRNYVRSYVAHAKTRNVLRSVFPERLIDAMLPG